MLYKRVYLTIRRNYTLSVALALITILVLAKATGCLGSDDTVHIDANDTPLIPLNIIRLSPGFDVL